MAVGKGGVGGVAWDWVLPMLDEARNILWDCASSETTGQSPPDIVQPARYQVVRGWRRGRETARRNRSSRAMSSSLISSYSSVLPWNGSIPDGGPVSGTSMILWPQVFLPIGQLDHSVVGGAAAGTCLGRYHQQ